MDPTVIASLKLTYEEIQDADLLLPVTKHEPDFSKIKFYVVSGINEPLHILSILLQLQHPLLNQLHQQLEP